MVEHFIKSYAQKIVTQPEKIEVIKKELEPNFYEIEIISSAQDAGKLIGKDGRMISAIKTFILGLKVKEGNSYRIVVKSRE
ncbi:MAG: KH domain-containing protein [Helicobacter sp.]|nr:KH domain-containing protein [Helicobacter sp.]